MKPIIMMTVVVLVIGAGAIYYINQPSSFLNTTPTASDQVFSKDRSSSQPKQIFSENYLEYSPKAFEAAQGKRRVLFFYADWCPECRPADAQFKTSFNKLPKDLVLFRVNYKDTDTDHTEEALAAKYKITYQHTFVQLDDQGKEITRWHGEALNKLLSSIK